MYLYTLLFDSTLELVKCIFRFTLGKRICVHAGVSICSPDIFLRFEKQYSIICPFLLVSILTFAYMLIINSSFPFLWARTNVADSSTLLCR